MNILFSSYAFHPSIGGIESVSEILAEKFTAAGHEVTLITQSVGDEGADNPFRIYRKPSTHILRRLIGQCEIVFQNNISLRSLIPALLMRKPVLVVHQTWIQRPDGGVGWNDRLKRWLLPLVKNVAISAAVARHLGRDTIMIGNPYRDEIYRLMPEVPRDRSLAFLGRLVSDKGVDLLLEAMKMLRAGGLEPDLTIIGTGPEEENLRRLSGELGLKAQVTFAGYRFGDILARILNQHRVLVVPSRWAEPFGVVALEGIACGCVVVGSEEGGLKEAIGPCGFTFENGNAEALAAALQRALFDLDAAKSLRACAPDHLARFRAEAVATAYLELMREMLQ